MARRSLGSSLAAFLFHALAFPHSNDAMRRRKNKKAKPSLSVALEKRRHLLKYSWCFDDKTFDRNMNDMNTLISSLRSFNSNYESRGVNMGSSLSNAPEGGDAVIRDKIQSISACATHANQGGGGPGGSFMEKPPHSYSSERHEIVKTFYISKQRSSKTGKMLILLM